MGAEPVSRSVLCRVSAALGLGALTVVVPVSAAVAAGCAVPTGVYTNTTPWAQRQLELSSLAPLSIGSGQRIAVIGTGIDAGNGQFARSQVQPGVDVLGGSGSADTDCDGRGTVAAGVIGAQPDDRTTMVGVAPGAKLIPIRYTQATSSGAGAGDPAKLAAAIDGARALQATIILVAVPATVDNPQLRAAVTAAQAGGAIVVSPAAAGKAGERTFPTSYSGVVAVGGVDERGGPVTVESGDYLSVSAPGTDLASLAAGANGKLGHSWPSKDPSFASAYVAGVLADVWSYLPRLTARLVVNRVLVTAGAGGAAVHDARLGWGVIDPMRAVTARLPADVPAPGRTHAVVQLRPVGIAAAELARPHPGRRAGYLALGGLGAAAVIGFGAAALRQGQRRGWRPERARACPADVWVRGRVDVSGAYPT
jgi:membrane-anchored mycosin MYCP